MHAILADNYFWLPRQASTVAKGTDDLFNAILWLCVFFFVLVTVLLVAFVIKYRHKPGETRDVSATHSMTLELTWTIIPSILVVFLYYYGFKEYMNLAVEPPNAYSITATGRMWAWAFSYPGGYSDGVLHVPVNVPVRVVLQSDDVIHSLFIPEFRVKKDVVPGRYNRLWFQATVPGTYDIYCAGYCGTNHSTMRSKVVVHESQADFDAWLKKAIESDNNGTPVEKGQRIYTKNGCAQCHSVDGTNGTGPSWRDMFGRMETMQDNTQVLVDEAYVKESVLQPQAKIVKGYGPVMPPFAFNDEQIGSLVAFMQSISKNYHATMSTGVGVAPTTLPTSAPATSPSAAPATGPASAPAQ